MRFRQFNRLSVSASLMIVVVAVFWVWNAYDSARTSLEELARQQSVQMTTMFESKLEHYGRFMTNLATLIANEDAINRLFYEARLAVDAEGGGAGGAEAARLREELLARLSPAWQKLREDGAARELHFHLPPATSFLRLHRPQTFGDDVSRIRPSVVQTNDTFEASNGFEVGIASGGIRGVVPVSRTLEDGTVFHIGSVEAGIGMNALLLQLQREMELEFALLVDTEFLRATLVEDAFENFVATTPSFDRFSLMNSTLNEDAEQVVALLGDDLFERDDWEPLQELEMGTFAMARIPLRSFIGQRDPSRADAGSIVAWVPLNDAVVTFKRDVAEAIVIALFIVFFLEAMLFFALGQEQKLAMQRKESVTDALTGVSNRRHFDEVLDAEIRRGARGGHPITVILADVDYFKRYNDHYGHQMGDDCLAKVAEAMSSELRRAGDFIARYGGEEFAVVLPDASMTAGLAVAEKLRRAVESLRIPHEKHPGGQKVTVSMGVASGRVSQNDAKAIVAMADEALYRAKGAGRNNSQGLRFGDEGEAGQPLPLLYR